MIRAILVLLALGVSISVAQQPPPVPNAIPPSSADVYTPPDEELWRNMSQAFSNLSMPAPAHQQVQAIMRQVEQEARVRAAMKTRPSTSGATK